MRGRKPKPTRLKLIDGNPGKRPIGREPQPPASQPTCPAHLSPAAKSEWKRLAKMLNAIGVVTQADRAVLAAYPLPATFSNPRGYRSPTSRWS